MDCGEICRRYSRYLLILFNFLFLLTGVIILSVGASVKAYYHEFDTFLDDKYLYGSDLLIVIGIVIFLISFLGCFGALKENACMTLTFSTLLIIIFILEVVAGIGGILLKNKADGMLEKALGDTMKEYGVNNTKINELWDHVQMQFDCCGIDTPHDWLNRTNTTNGQLPLSCCTIPAGTVGSFACDLNTTAHLHKRGCLAEFSDFIKGHAVTIESVGLGFAILQLLGIILSCYLSKKIKSDYETV